MGLCSVRQNLSWDSPTLFIWFINVVPSKGIFSGGSHKIMIISHSHQTIHIHTLLRRSIIEVAAKRIESRKKHNFLIELLPFSNHQPLLNIIWLINNLHVSDSWDLQSEEKTLYGQVEDAMLGGLRPAVIYQVRVFAENELGRSKEGRVLQVIAVHQSNISPLTTNDHT